MSSVCIFYNCQSKMVHLQYILILCRLVTDINDPELASALSAVDFSAQRGSIDPHQGHHNDLELEFQSSRRMLTQTALPNNVGVASTDLGCDGCSGYDNRVQVSVIYNQHG